MELKLSHKILKRYYLLKLYYSRTSSYTGIPLDLLEKFTLVTLLLSDWGIKNTAVVIGAMAFFVVVITVLGYIDIQMKNPHLENGINNMLNQELMDIHAATTKRGKNG